MNETQTTELWTCLIPRGGAKLRKSNPSLMPGFATAVELLPPLPTYTREWCIGEGERRLSNKTFGAETGNLRYPGTSRPAVVAAMAQRQCRFGDSWDILGQDPAAQRRAALSSIQPGRIRS